MNAASGTRAFAIALLVASLFRVAPVEGASATAARHAILLDHKTGTVLFAKNADEPTPPASLGKLMTLAVVFEELRSGRLALDTTFVVSERAWREGGAVSGGSTMFLPVGAEVSVADLLRGIIVQSGNDACIVIAEGISGSVEAFAWLMNRRADEIGLKDSHFENPHGLPDPAQKVTVSDLARLASHLITTYPQLYALFGELEFTYNKVRQVNRNRLLASVPGADGLKTGHTKESGYGIVGSAARGERRLIVAINGLNSGRRRDREAARLLEWGFRAFEVRTLFSADEAIASARVYGGERGSVALHASTPVRVAVMKGDRGALRATVAYLGPVEAPVSKGQPIGTLRVMSANDSQLLTEAPLHAAEAVPPGSLASRAWDAVADLALRHLW
jgi:D-alanyl-D-alanine carboxypeptidase (penicillin-binding protein 5/6)